mmetsp:Transcript_27122/g.82206  ORF Transcript_27122/g.82206 Transcript_27122/m.82206 type:complete len:107 (-) Transcript_27122:346-666(-)
MRRGAAASTCAYFLRHAAFSFQHQHEQVALGHSPISFAYRPCCLGGRQTAGTRGHDARDMTCHMKKINIQNPNTFPSGGYGPLSQEGRDQRYWGEGLGLLCPPCIN